MMKSFPRKFMPWLLLVCFLAFLLGFLLGLI
jgi:hypothetical protein